MASVLLAIGFAALAIDLPVSRACLAEKGEKAAFHVPGDLRKSLNLCEAFAHGFGMAMICLTVCVLDRSARRAVLRIVVCGFGAGLVVDLLKLFVIARTRPYALEPSAVGFTGNVWATFHNWVPLFTSESLDVVFDAARQSCPSAHSATAAGLAVALAWRYPQGRWLFGLLGALAAAQRVTSGAHFLSDAFWGAAVGLVFASACVHSRRLGGWFTRFENRRD